jgi:ADP-ribose pyrophosphatase
MQEKCIKKETMFEGFLFHVSRETIEFANGKQATRDIVRHRPAVVILAVTESKDIVLVKQFRRAVGSELIELPAGGMDKNEEPLAAAKRELKEETGIEAAAWERLFGGYAAPGFCDEFLHIYLAKDLTFGQPSPDEDEYVEMITEPLSTVEEWIADGRIADLKTVAAVTFCKAKGLWTAS